MARPITVTPKELARVRYAAWARQYADEKHATFDQLSPKGQGTWLREAEAMLAEIKRLKPHRHSWLVLPVATGWQKQCRTCEAAKQYEAQHRVN